MVLPNECHNIKLKMKLKCISMHPQVYFYKQDNNKCRK